MRATRLFSAIFDWSGLSCSGLWNRGYEPEDLFQIGCIGLLKSVDKFDLSYDVKFSTYAVPMIIGEIQRFLRDDGTLKVSRSLKEMANKVRKTKDELSKVLGRLPTIKEVAEQLGITPEDVVFAQEANKPPTSIHETVFENDGDPITLMDQIADESQDRWFDKLALNEAIGGLSERERLIVFLRYYRDQTQSEVAARLGISQVQVSRLEKKILLSIRNQIAHNLQSKNRNQIAVQGDLVFFVCADPIILIVL